MALNILFGKGLTLSQTTNFRLKLKEFADDNFELDENCRKFSIRVENTVGKGDITCYEQFLLFPYCIHFISIHVISVEFKSFIHSFIQIP